MKINSLTLSFNHMTWKSIGNISSPGSFTVQIFATFHKGIKRYWADIAWSTDWPTQNNVAPFSKGSINFQEGSFRLNPLVGYTTEYAFTYDLSLWWTVLQLLLPWPLLRVSWDWFVCVDLSKQVGDSLGLGHLSCNKHKRIRNSHDLLPMTLMQQIFMLPTRFLYM